MGIYLYFIHKADCTNFSFGAVVATTRFFIRLILSDFNAYFRFYKRFNVQHFGKYSK